MEELLWFARNLKSLFGNDSSMLCNDSIEIELLKKFQIMLCNDFK